MSTGSRWLSIINHGLATWWRHGDYHAIHIAVSRDGPEWAARRKSLNKVFLKRQTVSAYADQFNQVITDLLERWRQLSDVDANGMLTTLERELYNWSIECE